jgi:hypothetical protein
MSFRSSLKSSLGSSLALALILSVWVAGCSFRQNPPANSQFDVKTDQLGCMDKAGAELNRFFQGSASMADVDAVWNCGSDALQAFMDKTHGAVPGSYSAEELREFIAKYFVKQVSLTPDLVKQIGFLKQVLVGGAVDRLTVDEIRRIQSILEVFRAQSQTLRTFMPILPTGSQSPWTGISGLRWQDITREYLDHFSDILNTAALEIGGALQESGQPYSFSKLDGLIQALIQAIPQSAEFQDTLNSLNSLHANMGMYAQIKSTLLVPDASLLSNGNDWQDVLSTAVRWAGVFVKLSWYTDDARLTVAAETLTQGEGLITLGKIFDEVQSILGGVVHRHSSQLITFEEMNQLISVFPATSLPVSAQSLKLTLPPLIQRIIGGNDLGVDGRKALGITPGILKKLQDEFYNWYEGQRFLETLYQRIEKQLNDQAGASYQKSTLLKSDAALGLWKEVEQQTNPQWNSITKLAAARIKILLGTLRPLLKDDDNEITFPKYDEGMPYSLHDLMAKNWMQSLSRLLVRGYAEKDPGEPQLGIPIRSDVDNWGVRSNPLTGAGVSLPEFKVFFGDFKPVGVELKFFSPADSNAAADRFREGNVFTYVSDGNNYLDLDEATTLLAFAISAKYKSDRIHSGIAEQCKTSVLDSIYGQPLIDMGCYDQNFFGKLGQYWHPGAQVSGPADELVSYYTNLTPDNQVEFNYLLQVSGRTNGYQVGVPMTIDDTEGLVAALQYIEAIFTRFDINDTGFLNPSEAETAFPVFEATLQEMGEAENPPKKLSATDADLVFTYMLAKGELPAGTLDVILWYLEKQIPVIGDFKADRIRILQIFAALAQATNATAATTPTIVTKPKAVVTKSKVHAP